MTPDRLLLATRGSALSKGLGKQGFYAQVDLDQPKAYAYAVELMSAAAVTADAVAVNLTDKGAANGVS